MRRGLLRLLLPILALTALLVPVRKAAATEPVDVILVLAADVSRSLDATKFRLQREGYAQAIVNKRVLQAIESGPLGRIAICFMEWSGPFAQAVLIDWTVIASAEDAQAFAHRVRHTPRPFMDRTAIGDAIDFSVRLIEKSPYDAPRRVIDVSGDGTSNAGRSPTEARDAALARGIVINGLAILTDVPLVTNPTHTHPPGGLKAYYENNVIGGPGAFALAAESFDAFGAAILSKLVKEIAAAPAQDAPLLR